MVDVSSNSLASDTKIDGALPSRAVHLEIFANRQALDQKAAAHPEIGSDALATLDGFLAGMAAPVDRRLLPPLAGRLLVRRVLLALDADGLLPDWAAANSQGESIPVGRDPWLVRAYHRAIVGLREAGITAAHLAQHRQISSELSVLRAVLLAYEEALDAVRMLDGADRERLALLALAQGRMPPAYTGLRSAQIHAGGELLGGRLDLVNGLAAQGIAVSVTVPMDADRPELFRWPEASLHGLETRGHPALELQFCSRVGVGPLAALRKAQFTDAQATDAPAHVFHLPRGSEHSRHVVGWVRHYLAQGVRPHQICIATPDIDGLGHRIVETLASARIRPYCRRGRPLLGRRSARILRGLIQIGQADFPREGVIALWQALDRRVALPKGEAGPAWVAHQLRRSGVRSESIAGGYRAALERLIRIEERGSHRLDKAERESRVCELRLLSEAIETLLEDIRTLPKTGRLAEHLAAIGKLLAKWEPHTTPGQSDADQDADPDNDQDAITMESEPAGLAGPAAEIAALPAPIALESRSQTGVACSRFAVGAQAAEEGADAAIEELIAMLSLAASEMPDDADWQREEAHATLMLWLSERRLPRVGLRAWAVPVVALEDLVGTHYRVVILAGMDAEAFPRAARPDRVLTDALRAEINRHVGPRLLQYQPTTGRGALRGDARDLWLWMEALAAAQEALVVSYSTAPGEALSGQSEVVEELCRSLGAAPTLCAAMYAMPAAKLSLWGCMRDRHERWAWQNFGKPGAQQDGMAQDATSRVPSGVRRPLWRRWQAAHGHDKGVFGLEPEAASAWRARLLGGRGALAWQDLQQGLPGAPSLCITPSLSTSRIDGLGRCRLWFFLAQGLGLAQEEIPALGADAAEQGTLAHSALEHVYRGLKNWGGTHWQQQPTDVVQEAAHAIFKQCQNEILAELCIHPLLQKSALEQAWDAVRAQLPIDTAKDGWQPIGLEYRFDDRKSGEADAKALRLLHPQGGLCLRVHGSVDRIDRQGAADPKAAQAQLRIIDYKRTLPEASRTRHFQLPIYAAVAARDFASEPKPHEEDLPVFADAAWRRLADGRVRVAKDVGADTDRVFGDEIWQRLDAVAAGDITADPEAATACQRCEMLGVCRFGRRVLDGALEERHAGNTESHGNSRASKS